MVLQLAGTLRAQQPGTRHLITVLADITSTCEPPAALALHCLIFLASSSPVVR